jgi:hypothetical protein
MMFRSVHRRTSGTERMARFTCHSHATGDRLGVQVWRAAMVSCVPDEEMGYSVP